MLYTRSPTINFEDGSGNGDTGETSAMLETSLGETLREACQNSFKKWSVSGTETQFKVPSQEIRAQLIEEFKFIYDLHSRVGGTFDLVCMRHRIRAAEYKLAYKLEFMGTSWFCKSVYPESLTYVNDNNSIT